MDKNYLIINAGNTSVTFAIFNQNHPIKVWNLPTTDFHIKYVEPGISGSKISIYNVFIASVVPSIDHILMDIAWKLTRKPPVWITADSNTDLKIDYTPRTSLGADRLANAVAARAAFPNQPVITVDVGTAINIDCVTKDSIYIGGMISPGPWIAAKALNEFTGKLPLVELNKFNEVSIGKDTESCIASGILLGSAGLVDRLIEECKKSIGQQAVVLATGGGAKLIIKFCKKIDTFDQYLTLKGIYNIGLRNQA